MKKFNARELFVIGNIYILHKFPILQIINKIIFNYLDRNNNVFNKKVKNLYLKFLNDWVVNYILNSNSLIEKKYKLIFVALWLENNGTNFNNLLNKNIFDKIHLIAKEIQQGIGADYSIIDFLFSKEVKRGVNLLLNKESYIDNKYIIKKVYHDFLCFAFLGKHLNYLSSKRFQFFADLQEFKFSKFDIGFIQKNDINNLSLALYINDDGKKVLNKLINNEDNIENLKVLGKNFKDKKNLSETNPSFLIETKIQYLELKNNNLFKNKNDKSKNVII